MRPDRPRPAAHFVVTPALSAADRHRLRFRPLAKARPAGAMESQYTSNFRLDQVVLIVSSTRRMRRFAGLLGWVGVTSRPQWELSSHVRYCNVFLGVGLITGVAIAFAAKIAQMDGLLSAFWALLKSDRKIIYHSASISRRGK